MVREVLPSDIYTFHSGHSAGVLRSRDFRPCTLHPTPYTLGFLPRFLPPPPLSHTLAPAADLSVRVELIVASKTLVLQVSGGAGRRLPSYFEVLLVSNAIHAFRSTSGHSAGVLRSRDCLRRLPSLGFGAPAPPTYSGREGFLYYWFFITYWSESN